MKVTGQIYTSRNEGSVLFEWGMDGFMQDDVGVFFVTSVEKIKFD